MPSTARPTSPLPIRATTTRDLPLGLPAGTKPEEATQRYERQQLSAKRHRTQHDGIGVRNDDNALRKGDDLVNRGEWQREVLPCHGKVDEGNLVTACSSLLPKSLQGRGWPVLRPKGKLAEVLGQQRIQVDRPRRCAAWAVTGGRLRGSSAGSSQTRPRCRS